VMDVILNWGEAHFPKPPKQTPCPQGKNKG
jgi:hypothetical protein